jgi:hypothetical protein
MLEPPSSVLNDLMSNLHIRPSLPGAVAVLPPIPRAVTALPLPPPPPPGSLHDMIALGDNGLPRHRQTSCIRGFYHNTTGAEFQLVTAHFLQTLGKSSTVHQVQRVMNPVIWRQLVQSGNVTFMFHGCKTEANEAAIVQQGFRVDLCKSGGSNFGTWFAYNSQYSDGNFAFNDANGWRHLFVCCVSKHQVKKDNPGMRVVGQGCAYPMWIVKYS